MMKRWADEEEQERSRFPRHNNDNNGKRHNDCGGPSIQQDPARKRKPDDTVGTNLTKSSTTKCAQSIPRAATRCGSARSYANLSSRHLQTLLKRSRTRMTKTTRKISTGSNSRKMSSTSYLEEILASPSGPRSYYSEKFFQLSQQFRDH